ncbi:MAG: Fe-S cluster assembly ATPase SufC [Proteobacteria bacterium]|nr:Fe-S cluster assembly ATPase SufC [Pseudomonadota bacterium]
MTLSISNLSVKCNQKEIINNLSLTIPQGQIHALMGPNGSGKSTLAHVLAGKPGYEITQGNIVYNNVDITKLTPFERAHLGIFLALQYPIEIPGLNNSYFIKAAKNAKNKVEHKPEVDAVDFLKEIKARLHELNMSENFLSRALNTDFSGGEKKCNEILQMLILNPNMAILDETDSGLDIDTLKLVANAILQFHQPYNSILLITHYERILNYITPDKVHIMIEGQIVQSGDLSLAKSLEAQGYAGIHNHKGKA